MTAIHQLDLVPLPEPPARGKPIAALRIRGEPRPWSRATPFLKNGVMVQRFSGPYAAWRTSAIRHVATWWNRREPIRVPVVCSVTSVFERPHEPVRSVQIDKHRTPYPWAWSEGRNIGLQQGDVDNLAKGILDVLQRVPTPLGMETAWTPVLADDRLVVDLRSTRWWAAAGEEPCVEVRLWHA